MARQGKEPTIGAGQKIKRWKLEEDKPLILRILPAIGSLAKDNDYCRFESKLFIGGEDVTDPKKTKYWVLASREEGHWERGSRDKIIDVRDPLIDTIRPIMARRDAITKAGQERGKSRDEIKEATKVEAEYLRRHSISGKCVFFAMDRNGDFGLLELSNTTKKDLYKQAKEWTANNEGQNPFGYDFGIWWVFTRDGKTFPIADKIVPFRTQVEAMVGGVAAKVETTERHAFTEAMEKAALASLPDLDAEMGRITYPIEVHAQLADAKGDPKKIREIMNDADKYKERLAREKAGKAVLPAGTPASTDEPDAEIDHKAILGNEDPFAKPAEKQADTPVAASSAPTPPAPIPPAVDPAEAALMEQLVALRAKTAAIAAAAVKAEPVTAAASKPSLPIDPTTASDAEFDKLFPTKKG